ncbi:MAG TPA: RICIN domain-containing protein [Mycobacterium sp.]
MSTKITRKRMLIATTALAALASLMTPATAQADTQIVRLQGGGIRFLDAHEISEKDLQVVSRPFQGFDTTQQWRINDLGGGVSTIQQVSSGRFLDAHEIPELDFRVVTRPQQDNDTQRWRVQDFGGGFVTIQQVSSGRFLEATLDGDFNVVTRTPGSNQQTWRVGDP